MNDCERIASALDSRLCEFVDGYVLLGKLAGGPNISIIKVTNPDDLDVIQELLEEALAEVKRNQNGGS